MFVPCLTFEESVACLDDRRLYKQALEALQLLGVILDLPKADGSPRKGWRNHPAALQWKPWPGALRRYAETAIDECRRRGMNVAGLERLLEKIPVQRSRKMPNWWGDERVHSSHRARLLQKDFEHYSRFNWPEANDPNLFEQSYWWAIPEGNSYRLERRTGRV